MTKQRSRYDELHDHYYELLSTKSGTRYERLAAVVFKYLEQSGTVIHDLKLVGDSGVSHQMDVAIERGGKQQRIVLECKDFDISGDKVGLGIIRDFYGAIADINPDEAYVVTCNGFTSEAELYARSKQIGLVVLREFRESDWAGRIQEINLHLIAVTPSSPKVNFEFKRDEDSQKIAADIQTISGNLSGPPSKQPVFFNTPEGRFEANDFIKRNMNYSVNTPPGTVEHNVDMSDITFEIDNLGSVELKCLKISYEIFHVEAIIEIGGNKIAKLLLQGIGSDKKVIWDEDMRKFKIDEVTGEVL
ncbi:MAG: restriction endonuclease [Aphanothece sp. CMT-3BRIN-NPC111]|nr:restriction endonuclease [Aphanothece sp. CMT-3BRIN-NPC111]